MLCAAETTALLLGPDPLMDWSNTQQRCAAGFKVWEQLDWTRTEPGISPNHQERPDQNTRRWLDGNVWAQMG